MPNIEVENADQEQVAEQTKKTVVKSKKATKWNSRHKKLALIAAVTLLLGAAIVYLQYDRSKLQQEVNQLSKSQEVEKVDEAKELSEAVGSLIELPTDETPTIATVTDASKVKDKPFFAKAQNGDKVLLYAKSGRAILYRPSTQKLIEVSTLNLNADQEGTTQESQ